MSDSQDDIDAWQQQAECEREQVERAMWDRHAMSVAELHAVLDEMGVPHGVPAKLEQTLKERLRA